MSLLSLPCLLISEVCPSSERRHPKSPRTHADSSELFDKVGNRGSGTAVEQHVWRPWELVGIEICSSAIARALGVNFFPCIT